MAKSKKENADMTNGSYLDRRQQAMFGRRRFFDPSTGRLRTSPLRVRLKRSASPKKDERE